MISDEDWEVFVDQPVSEKQRQKWTVILLYK